MPTLTPDSIAVTTTVVVPSVSDDYMVTSGSSRSVVIPACPAGDLSRLIVKQTGGSLEGFTVDVYDCDPDDVPNTDDADVHKVIAQQTAAPAADNIFFRATVRAPYRNVEVSAVSAVRRSQLYLVISPSGTGSKPFEIGLTTVPDVL